MNCIKIALSDHPEYKNTCIRKDIDLADTDFSEIVLKLKL